MSSSLRRPSQIPISTKFFLGVGTVTNFDGTTAGTKLGPEGAPAVIEKNNTVSLYSLYGPTRTMDEITEISSTAGINVESLFVGDSFKGILFKDLGRTVTVYDNSGRHVSTYRECQLIGGDMGEGANYEGVNGGIPLYNAAILVRVWGANGKNVVVARLG